jgi:hypothetical protein
MTFETLQEENERLKSDLTALRKHHDGLVTDCDRWIKENALLNKVINAECLELHEDMGGCPADSYAEDNGEKLEMCHGCRHDQKRSVKCWREILLSRGE